MNPSAQQQLLGHLLGALDEDERAEVESQLGSNPECRKELALLRRKMEPLEALRRKSLETDPPPGLAERTCQLVAEHRAAPAKSKGRMRPVASPPSWISRMSWLDMIMATTVVAAACLLIIPAVQSSRYHARLSACQDNLRDLGGSLTQYSQINSGYFPPVPTEGKLASAGIYAPRLAEKGLLSNVSRVVCPETPLASKIQGFHVPTFRELELAPPAQVNDLRPTLGGSYGYNLGYVRNGEYQATKNLYRDNFAIMSDSPNPNVVGYQSSNHGGRGQNVLFENGSVRFVTGSKIGADDIFTNNDGQIAAGLNADDSVIGSSGAAPVTFVKNSKR